MKAPARRYDRLKVLVNDAFEKANPKNGREMYHVPVAAPNRTKEVRGMRRWEITHLRRLMRFITAVPRYDRAGKPIAIPNPLNILWWECPSARIDTSDSEQIAWFAALDPIDRFILCDSERFTEKLRRERRKHGIISIFDPEYVAYQSRRVRYG